MGKDKVTRLQNGRISQDDAEVLKPTLMHSFVVDFPDVATPQTSSYSSNSPFDTTYCLRTVESSNSAKNLKSKFSGHAPSIKSIEWHLGAVPTLVAFSTTCDPIKIVLPRNGADLEVTRILSTISKRVESSDTSTPEVEPGYVHSRQNSSCAVQVGSRSRVIAPRVHSYSFGAASLKSEMVIAVDSIGSLIVLFDPVNDGLKLREPSSYLESERNKRVKAVCLSGDDSVVCIAYSVSSSLADTAKMLAPCRGLLSIENLHEAISATQHGSSLRSSRGFRHILAGTSLRDAIYVPARTDSDTASTIIEASSCPAVCPTEASSCPAVCLNEATHRTRSPAANQAAYTAISQSAEDESNATEYLRFDSSSVSVMDSLLFIKNRARSRDGEAVEGSSSSNFLNRHSLTDSVTKSKKQPPLNALSSATGSNDFCNYHTPASFDIFGEVEVKWLREPGAAPCSTDCGKFQNGKPTTQCNESKNENLNVISTGEKVMRVPIMDPLLAHPDILFYREHTQPLPSKLLSSPEAAATAAAVFNQSPLLMGHLAVGSTQSGRVLIYALKATPIGHSATIHHTFDLPENQVQ